MVKTNTEKLKSNRDFSYIFRRGHRVSGRCLQLTFIRKKAPRRRLGVTCSRRFPNAVARNRGKRLLREAYRSIESELPGHLDLIFVMTGCRPELTVWTVAEDMRRVLIKADLLPDESNRRSEAIAAVIDETEPRQGAANSEARRQVRSDDASTEMKL